MNLIITCARHLEPETKEELKSILEELGDSVRAICGIERDHQAASPLAPLGRRHLVF